jgi:hypothetical protein
LHTDATKVWKKRPGGLLQIGTSSSMDAASQRYLKLTVNQAARQSARTGERLDVALTPREGQSKAPRFAAAPGAKKLGASLDAMPILDDASHPFAISANKKSAAVAPESTPADGHHGAVNGVAETIPAATSLTRDRSSDFNINLSLHSLSQNSTEVFTEVKIFTGQKRTTAARRVGARDVQVTTLTSGPATHSMDRLPFVTPEWSAEAVSADRSDETLPMPSGPSSEAKRLTPLREGSPASTTGKSPKSATKTSPLSFESPDDERGTHDDLAASRRDKTAMNTPTVLQHQQQQPPPLVNGSSDAFQNEPFVLDRNDSIYTITPHDTSISDLSSPVDRSTLSRDAFGYSSSTPVDVDNSHASATSNEKRRDLPVPQVHTSNGTAADDSAIPERARTAAGKHHIANAPVPIAPSETPMFVVKPMTDASDEDVSESAVAKRSPSERSKSVPMLRESKRIQTLAGLPTPCNGLADHVPQAHDDGSGTADVPKEVTSTASSVTNDMLTKFAAQDPVKAKLLADAQRRIMEKRKNRCASVTETSTCDNGIGPATPSADVRKSGLGFGIEALTEEGLKQSIEEKLAAAVQARREQG